MITKFVGHKLSIVYILKEWTDLLNLKSIGYYLKNYPALQTDINFLRKIYISFELRKISVSKGNIYLIWRITQ